MLNALRIVVLYNQLRANPNLEMTPRTFFFAGKAAPAYHLAKLIIKFLNPARDGAVLPVLHLNGYKIANPTILSRISHEELESLFVGYGYDPYFVEGSDPDTMAGPPTAVRSRN